MENIEEFDAAFQELSTQLVEIAFEYVGYNKEEVNTIYIFGSIEANVYLFSVFYRINNELVNINEVNKVSVQQYDISNKSMMALLSRGNKILVRVDRLFEKLGEDVPTVLKMIYKPGTEELDFEFDYELQYSNDEVKIAADISKEWFNELKKAE